jgi:hypothetical protein
MYYDATDFLEFRRLYPTEGLGDGYAVSKFLGDEFGAYVHVEVPSYYQGYEDEEALPVLKIDDNVFNSSKNPQNIAIESIKLNEGLKSIGNSCFGSSLLKEVVIPDSVIGGLYNTFSGCSVLKKAVIGNGITDIKAYTFYNCPSLEEVILGESVKVIHHRAFGLCRFLKNIVLPRSLVSLPEHSIYAPAAGMHVYIQQEWDLENVFLNITEEEYNALLIPKFERNNHGLILQDGVYYNPDGANCPTCTANGVPTFKGFTTYGWHESWQGNAKIYFKDTWHYDSEGKPVAN